MFRRLDQLFRLVHSGPPYCLMAGYPTRVLWHYQKVVYCLMASGHQCRGAVIVAGYLYSCAQCGPWEVQLPIGTAQNTCECPRCGQCGRRRYTPPMLTRTSPVLAAQLVREEASRDAPAVVESVPKAARRPKPVDPRWRSLPKP